MLDYADFYNIAEYGNEHWKGKFSPKEVACNAYDYKVEYALSLTQGKPTHTMIELCRLICEDMGFADCTDTQEESENDLTLERMKNILENFLLEIL